MATFFAVPGNFFIKYQSRCMVFACSDFFIKCENSRLIGSIFSSIHSGCHRTPTAKECLEASTASMMPSKAIPVSFNPLASVFMHW